MPFMSREIPKAKFEMPTEHTNVLKQTNTEPKSIRWLSDYSLWLSGAIWQQNYVSALAKVTDLWLTVLSHYLNQRPLIIKRILLHSPA